MTAPDPNVDASDIVTGLDDAEEAIRVARQHVAEQVTASTTPEPAAPVRPIAERNVGGRKRSGRALDDFDLVSFNCKLPHVTRKQTRMFAAEHDVDIQDVVNDALIEYLTARGVAVPRTSAERDT